MGNTQQKGTPTPTHYLSFAILNADLGFASVVSKDALLVREPASWADAKKLADQFTEDDIRKGRLPQNHRYMLLSWSRYADKRTAQAAPVGGSTGATPRPFRFAIGERESFDGRLRELDEALAADDRETAAHALELMATHAQRVARKLREQGGSR